MIQIATTNEQSKKLLDLGLNPETADLKRIRRSDYIMSIDYNDSQCDDSDYNIAWSLSKLISLIPERCCIDYDDTDDSEEDIFQEKKSDRVYLTIEDNSVFYRNNEFYPVLQFIYSLDLFDNLIYCIKYLVENNLFNKEYLKIEHEK